MPVLPMVGDEFAGYRLRAVVGRGGMSVVYQAENPRLGSVVALKVLAPEIAADDVFRARFLEESRIAASLNHPNVIPIYDTGPSGDLLYIAMRYVAGTDLRALLKKHSPIPPADAIFLCGQAARALDAAHRKGLVHRDVKPGNLLIEHGQDGDPDHVYLSDFGITKYMLSRSGLTKTGEFLGTIDYAAPEQIQETPVDGRADEYSLGCVLYECLTGRVPFPKERDAAIIWAHVEEMPPPPSTLQPELPPAVDDVFARVLAKRPEDRYASCREFVDEARASLGIAATQTGTSGAATAIRAQSGGAASPEVISQRGSVPPPAAGAPPGRDEPAPGSHRRRPPRRLWGWIAAAAAVVLIAAGVGVYLGTRNAAGGPRQSRTSIRAAGGPQQSLTPVQAAGNWGVGINSPVAVQYAGTADLDGQIWVAGGLLGSQSATNKTEFYDPTLRTWNPGPPLPFSLNHVMMVPYQNTVWLIGGFTAQNGNVLANASARVLILDKAQDRWVYGPSLHHARAAGAAAVVGNDIVVVGGRTGTSGPSSSQPVTTTEVFNGTSWHDAAPIPVSCNHLAAASDGTYLYAVGGHQITDTSTIAMLQRFDPATGQWTQLPPMPAPASGLGAVIVGDQLITVGGDNGLIVFGTVRAYNLATKKWSTLPSLPQPRTGLGVVYYNNILYAVNGASQPGHVASTNTLQILRVPS